MRLFCKFVLVLSAVLVSSDAKAQRLDDGHHLVRYLSGQGYWVRGADLVLPAFEPSRADELLTSNLKQALSLVDVRVLDHLIVAGSSTVSFAERGLL